MAFPLTNACDAVGNMPSVWSHSVKLAVSETREWACLRSPDRTYRCTSPGAPLSAVGSPKPRTGESAARKGGDRSVAAPEPIEPWRTARWPPRAHFEDRNSSGTYGEGGCMGESLFDRISTSRYNCQRLFFLGIVFSFSLYCFTLLFHSIVSLYCWAHHLLLGAWAWRPLELHNPRLLLRDKHGILGVDNHDPLLY